MTNIRITLLLAFVFSVCSLFGQNGEVRITRNFNNVSLSQVLQVLNNEYGATVYVKPEWVAGVTVSSNLEDKTVLDALSILLRGTTLSVQEIKNGLYVLFDEQAVQEQSYTVSIRGTVRDANNGEVVIGASVLLPELELGTVTDVQGNYALQVPSGSYLLKVKAVGNSEISEVRDFTQDQQMDIELFSKTLELDDIVISGRSADENISDTRSGRVSMELESIRKLPALMGEPDISRIVQSLPGVQTVGEGARGFNIRGGNIDQNLVLMDGIPIYNSSHLLGFFSVFNPDLVSNFSVLKGSIPAEYGGKLSSVIAVEMSTPSSEGFELSGGVGPVSNKLSANIPISEKLSVRLGGRYSDPSWLLNNVPDRDVRASSARFSDGNVKLRYQINEKNVVEFTSYLSTDFYDLGRDSAYAYDSKAFGMNWVSDINEQWFTQTTIYHSDYDAELQDATTNRQAITENGIQSTGLKSMVDYHPNDYFTMRAGVEAKASKIDLGRRTPDGSDSQIEFKEIGEEESMELALFGETNFQLNESLNVTGGIRLSSFNRLNANQEFVFSEEQARSAFSITDTLDLGSFKNLYNNIEPRFGFNLRVSQESSLKGNYTRSVQYEHLFTNSTASLPTDQWRTSSETIRPQVANQFSLGYFRNFNENLWETSVELYYKDFERLNLVRTGANVLLKDVLEADILEGTGRSIGAEFLIRKNRGKVTGWLSYFYSRTRNRVASNFREDRINNGEFFAADFDRPHNLNFSTSMKLSRLWTMSANFVYNTGRPVTIPVSSYVVGGVRLFTVNERNNVRTPDIHRLDLSWTLEGNNRRNSRWRNSFTFSVYNVYGRDNPFSVFAQALDNTIPRTFRLTVFGNPIPSFTYNFQFK
ncbi:MAG: carboxypeptidase-like regulatory domain-containing protein [Cytophagales bacterium]|nr:carboxypeptidase-like regulatory domain-containing protein [Cytophagales bacterium]